MGEAVFGLFRSGLEALLTGVAAAGMVAAYGRLAVRFGWVKPNADGRLVPAGTGLALALGWGAALVADHALLPDPAGRPKAPAVAAGLLAVAATGWVDDAFGTTAVRGILGHLRAMRRTLRPTTGGLRLAVYPVAGALGAAASGAPPAWGALLFSTLAHGLNLLDKRPLRALKAFALVALPAFSSGGPPAGAAFFGGLVPLLWADRRKTALFGEAGVATFAWALFFPLLQAPPALAGGVWAAFAGLAALAERTSLSALIGRSRWLSALDRLGVLP
ncbi:MAG: hypothetical protein IMX05_05570 [Hydrogenibacillus schlegelii]|nr:hypothetical protein [Hydrogenibacillus schlegelii]